MHGNDIEDGHIRGDGLRFFGFFRSHVILPFM
jgi:hypothetical protein